MKTKTTSYIALNAILLNGPTAPTEFRLVPAGSFRARDGRPENLDAWTMDAAAANDIISRMSAQADQMVIDYEHQTLYKEQNGQPAPAAGWIGGLEWREGDGLYATNVDWTTEAADMIAAKKYRYISPILHSNTKTGQVTNVIMAGLTNYAGIDGLTDLSALHALFTTDDNNQGKPMNKAILDALGLDSTADDTVVLTAITALQKKAADAETQITALSAKIPNPAEFVPVSALTEVQTQLAALAAKQNTNEVEQLIQANLAKLPTPGLQQWARGMDVNALSAYLKEAPAVAALVGMQTNGQAPEGNDTNALSATTEELEAAKALGMDVADIIKNRGN